MLDLALTPDQEQLVDTVRDFCAREFAPHIQANDRAGRHAPEIFAKLASIGLPGVCFPQRYGGHGLDYLSLGLVCEELEYIDTVYRTVLSVHVGLVGMGLYTWATEEQKQRWLAPMARGEKLACYGLTEPDAGSDRVAMATTTSSTDRRSGCRTRTRLISSWSSQRRIRRPGVAVSPHSCSIALLAATRCARSRSRAGLASGREMSDPSSCLTWRCPKPIESATRAMASRSR